MVRDSPNLSIPKGPPRRANIVQDVAQPVERDVLATSIVKIADAAKRLTASGLNRRAVVVLVSHSSGLSARDVNAVLDSLETLTAQYTTR